LANKTVSEMVEFTRPPGTSNNMEGA